MQETRISRRRAAFIDARIGFNGKFRLRCLVQNLSETGAKLVLKVGADVPAEFVLSVPTNGEVQRGAYIRWRNHNSIGVEFTSPPMTSAEIIQGLGAWERSRSLQC